jgi:hypothetical protein
MKVSKKFFSVAVSLVVLSGCAAIDQSIQGIQKAASPIAVTDSLPQICQEAKSNPVRANQLYRDRGLTINGEVRSVKEGFQPRYRVYMLAGQVAIHAGTENQANINALSVGANARVTGVISNVSYDFNGCAIALKDATF